MNRNLDRYYPRNSKGWQMIARDPNKLRSELLLLLIIMVNTDRSLISFAPVVNLNTSGTDIDYFGMITKDLDTVKEKLRRGEYREPTELNIDLKQLFDRVWKNNCETSRVYRYCTKLSERFDPVMSAFGYCCKQNYAFTMKVLTCVSKCGCKIERDAEYYDYLDGYLVVCCKCFKDFPGDTVTYGRSKIRTDKFEKKKNNHLEREPFVQCSDCGQKQHQICVLYHKEIEPHGFTCEKCYDKKQQKRKPNKFNAKNLPQSELGNFIEMQVNNFLKRENVRAGLVHIRLTSSSDCIMDVKPEMQSRFVGRPATFPYRAKTLHAFQEFEGKTICFFSMQVQEYGSDCPPPNARRVYLAYLDSVDFFKPRDYRTEVYREIILSYLDYAKQLGFTTAHIWSCPPREGGEYLFYCHPPEQKTPSQPRLNEWYEKMFKEALKDKRILGCKNIYETTNENEMTSVCDLPYFKGDFWPDAIEEIIRTSKQQIGNGLNNLSEQILELMRHVNECFFVISLRKSEMSIEDPDPLYKCDLMEGRLPFFLMARKKHFEFSSGRRAEYSTMCLLLKLHQNNRQQSMQRCIQNLEHACHCHDVSCRLISCQKVKRVLMHFKSCKKNNGGCTLCEQFTAICCYHAKNCKDDECRVPNCPGFQKGLREQNLLPLYYLATEIYS